MNELAGAPSKLKVRGLGRVGAIILTAVASAICMVVITDMYPRAKSLAADLVPGSATVLGATVTDYRVNAECLSQERKWSGFLFIGHWRYLSTYKVTVTNNGARSEPRGTIQFTSRSGTMGAVAMPPIANPSIEGKRQAGVWVPDADMSWYGTVAVEFDLPPPQSYWSFIVIAASDDGAMNADDLDVLLDTGGGLAEVRSQGKPAKQ